MTTTRNTRTSRRRNNASFGLLANGSSGPWDIAIDEATSGPNRWCAQIEGPSVTFSFEIPSIDIVGKMVRFLERRHFRPDVDCAGAHGGTLRTCGRIIVQQTRAGFTDRAVFLSAACAH